MVWEGCQSEWVSLQLFSVGKVYVRMKRLFSLAESSLLYKQCSLYKLMTGFTKACRANCLSLFLGNILYQDLFAMCGLFLCIIRF